MVIIKKKSNIFEVNSCEFNYSIATALNKMYTKLPKGQASVDSMAYLSRVTINALANYLEIFAKNVRKHVGGSSIDTDATNKQMVKITTSLIKASRSW